MEFNRIAWSLRKISLPIRNSDLVLDVGSGSSPHPAADVLAERYIDPKHRYSAMVIDRPTVLADACKMPFRDKTFDFVIAFHVLEHISDPSSFLNELQRIGKAGYIETPNAVFERLVPYDVHLLEIMNINDMLIINKKAAARPDHFLNELDLLPYVSGLTRQSYVLRIYGQLLLFTYPYWLLNYRKHKAYKAAVNVALECLPTNLVRIPDVTLVVYLGLIVVFAATTAIGLFLPVRMLARLTGVASRLSKSVRERRASSPGGKVEVPAN